MWPCYNDLGLCPQARKIAFEGTERLWKGHETKKKEKEDRCLEQQMC